MVHVVRELWQLARASHRRTIHDERHPTLFVSVFLGVHVQHHVHQAAHQFGAEAAIDDKPGPTDLGAARKIEYPQLFTDLPVRPNRRAVRSRPPPAADDAVGFFAPFRYVVQREVRQLIQQRLDRGFRVALSLLETSDRRADVSATGDER